MVTFPIAESLTRGRTKNFWREKLRPEQNINDCVFEYFCIVERLHSHTQNARFLTCIAVKRKGKLNYTNAVEDVYIAVV